MRKMSFTDRLIMSSNRGVQKRELESFNKMKGKVTIWKISHTTYTDRQVKQM